MVQNAVARLSEPPTVAHGPARLRRFGKYQLIGELGSGGMAVVYLAVARGPSGFKKLVVLKLLRDPALSDDSQAESEAERSTWVEMFLSEARLTARLNHPNLVQTLEAAEAEGCHYIVMEYLDGQSLQQIQDREKGLGTRLPLSARVRIVTDALAGLQYAHDLTDFDGVPLGVVHRDVSPQNIFVTFDGRVKVLDFGIAKLSTPSGHTETGVLKGKVRYMSPEQALGEPLDRATDVFAMGIVLWEALAERSLWQQKNEMQILQVLLNGDPLPAVGGVNPAVPERLSLACMKALAYRSEDRFASCAEFRSELLDCLEELPGEITNEEIGRSVAGMFAAFREQQRSNISKQLALLDAAEQAADPSGPVSEERPRRRTGRVWFLSALGFAIAFGGAYALSQGGANLVREQGAVPSALPAAVAAPLPTASELSPAARTAISEQPMGSSSAASAALPPGSNLPRRLRKRNKAGESTAESSAPPAATGAAPVSAPADGSRMQLDTGNPWSSGAAPAKP